MSKKLKDLQSAGAMLVFLKEIVTAAGRDPVKFLHGESDDSTSYLPVENDPYQRFVIETMPVYVPGYEDWRLVSVAHYGEMNGDAMRDPEIVFYWAPKRNEQGLVENPAEGYLIPVEFRNDFSNITTGRYMPPCVNFEPPESGTDWTFKVGERQIREIVEFCGMWVKNLREQGYIEAVKKAAVTEES